MPFPVNVGMSNTDGGRGHTKNTHRVQHILIQWGTNRFTHHNETLFFLNCFPCMLFNESVWVSKAVSYCSNSERHKHVYLRTSMWFLSVSRSALQWWLSIYFSLHELYFLLTHHITVLLVVCCTSLSATSPLLSYCFHSLLFKGALGNLKYVNPKLKLKIQACFSLMFT